MTVPQIVEVPDPTAPVVGAPRRHSTFSRLVRNPTAMICMIFLIAVIVIGIAAPLIAPFNQNLSRIALTNAKPFTSDFVLGGDSAGRDILSRLIWATRGTLLACLLVLVVSLVVGVVAGLIAGFYGGLADSVAGWVSNAILALPGTVLLIALYSVIGPSISTAMAVYGLLISPTYFRLVRGVVVDVRQALYVDAARVAGLSDLRIIFRHVLMAVRGPIIIQSAFVLAAGIGIQAGLEFLGLGNTREASWGGVLQTSFLTIYQNGGGVVAPAVLISLTTLAFVLLGNSLRDVLQVTSQQRPLRRREREKVRAVSAATAPVRTAASAKIDAEALLNISGLHIGYPSGDGQVTEVVKGVDLTVRRGEIHGLVGESGSGKSQTAFAVLGILPRNAVIVGGSAYFDGVDLLANDAALASARGRRIAYVPQEPMSNLDPTLTIGQQLSVGLRAVKKISKSRARAELLELLGRVGIKNPEAVYDLYPHQISGGMAQRVLITGAVAGDPDLIIADEPTTALDVTVQADVLELLRTLRDERGLGMVLVTHNLGVVADICDTVSVMRDGRIVETGEVRALFAEPQHPYTRELLSSTLTTKAS